MDRHMDDEGRPVEGTTSMSMVSKRMLTEMRDLTVKDQSLVLGEIQKHVLRHSLDPDPERDRSFLHPSDMAKSDWCYRADFYRMTGAPESKEHVRNPSFRMENIFEEGHDIHHKWQTWLWEMGNLY